MADSDGQQGATGYLTIVGAQATAVVARSDGFESAAALAALGQPDAAAALVALLGESGLASVPSFAYLGREPVGVRLLLRGGLQVHLSGSEPGVEPHVVTADGLATWHESIVRDGIEARIAAPDGEELVVVDLTGLPSATTASLVIGPMIVTASEPASAAALEAVRERKPHPVPVPVPVPVPEPVAAREPATLDQPVVAEDTIFPVNTGQVDLVGVPSFSTPEGTPEVPRPSRPDPTGSRLWEPPKFTNTDEIDLSHLFEDRAAEPEEAAVRPEVASFGSEPTAFAPGPGPEMGASGVISGVPGISAPAPARVPSAPDVAPVAFPADPPVTGPSLPAVRCPGQHPNPPHSDRCRTCGSEIVNRSVAVIARPSLGHLTFDTGQVVDVDRPLLIGRKPTADEGSPEPPGLVPLADEGASLSRVHLEVRLDGWDVVVIDRGSLNGTVVVLPGQEPVQLQALTPVAITDGTTIHLADAIACTFGTGPR